MDESGYKGFEVGIWHGMWAPRARPSRWSTSWSRACRPAWPIPSSRSAWKQLGAEVLTNEANPRRCKPKVKQQVPQWAELFKKAGVESNKGRVPMRPGRAIARPGRPIGRGLRARRFAQCDSDRRRKQRHQSFVQHIQGTAAACPGQILRQQDGSRPLSVVGNQNVYLAEAGNGRRLDCCVVVERNHTARPAS